MSGPKHGSYALSAEERARQEEERQRRIREERIRQEKERIRKEEERKRKIEEDACVSLDKQIKTAYQKLTEKQKKIQKFQTDLKERYNSLAGSTDNINNFVQAVNELLQTIKSFPKNYNKRQSQIMENYLNRLKNMIIKADIQQHPHIIKLLNICLNEANLREFSDSEDKFYKAVEKMEKKVVRHNLKQNITASPEAKEQLQQNLDEFHNLITPIMEVLPKEKELTELFKSVKVICDNTKFDIEYKISQVKKRFKGLLMQKERYFQLIKLKNDKQDKLSELVLEYKTLCSMLEQKPVENYNNVSDINKLIELNQNLHQTLRQQEEHQYIADSLNEVMSEMGHNIIASKIMEREKEKKYHSVYSMGEHTAINVHHSSDGGVMFEVSGFAKANGKVNEIDKLRVKEGMESFCGTYEVVKNKLEAKGIYVSNEKRKPPHERYARFIDIDTITGNKKRKRSQQAPQIHINSRAHT